MSETTLETDPAKINDEVRRKRELILREATSYAETRTDSRKLNKKRAKSRTAIEDAGLRTDAYQDGIRLVKDLTETERQQYMADLLLVLDVLGAKQGDLFPEERAKALKREQKAKDAAANKGQPKAASKKAAAAAESQSAKEQKEGEKLLDRNKVN